MSDLRRPFLRWSLAAILYLAFAAKREWAEVAAAAVVGVLAWMAHRRLRRLDHEGQTLLWPPALWLVRIAGRVVVDGVRIFAALARSVALRPPAGRLSTIPFDPGGDDGRSAMRRTWVTLGKSLTPNGIVIAVDRPHKRLLSHEVVVGGKSDIVQEWPV